MATANELREMKPEELDRMLTEQREALFNLRLKLRTGHLENTAALGAARREIARLTTVLHEAQLGIVHVVKGGAEAPHPETHKPKSRKGPSKKKTAPKKPKTKKTSRK
jgi:ribosomal protein L29